jgi:(E)-2-((N-methylformamido)methylene)succinate hydrolase
MPALDQILADGTHLRVEGTGRPLVLIHGVGMDLTMWDRLAARLTEDYRIIRYDMIGHGSSPKPAGPYRLKDFVEQLLRLADTLQLRKFDLLGFSMGGLVAQGFAVQHGDLLDHLFLLNTVYRRSPEERAAIAQRVIDVSNGGYPASVDTAIERWFTPAFLRDNPDIVEAVRRHMLGNDLAAYAAAYQVFATADAELADVVAGITTPTLVMTGSDDQRSTVAMAEALAACMPRAKASAIAGQRHLTPIECPDDIAARIRDYRALPNVVQGRSQHG